MATRPALLRLHRVLASSRHRLPCSVTLLNQGSFPVRSFSEIGDSKPDAATDLSTSMTKNNSASQKKSSKSELDPSDFTVRIEVKMPAMGNGGGKVLKWYKQKGDTVSREDVICDIETPDFTFGMETDDENLAIMGDILVEAPSDTIKDNEVLCILLHEESKSKKKVVHAKPK